jgi:hypothetical protein
MTDTMRGTPAHTVAGLRRGVAEHLTRAETAERSGLRDAAAVDRTVRRAIRKLWRDGLRLHQKLRRYEAGGVFR